MIFISLSGMTGDTLDGDDTEAGDPTVGVQRERGNFHNFKIVSLVGMCGLNFQIWATYAPSTLKNTVANCHQPTQGELEMSSNKELEG